MEKAGELYELSKSSVKLYSEISYQAGSWSAPKRIICKAEYNHKGPNTRFIINNLAHRKYRFIYRTIYCGRGAMELMIKEHKNFAENVLISFIKLMSNWKLEKNITLISN